MSKRIRTPNTVGATLWTPWGPQRRSERNAQQLAVRKLLKQIAAMNKQANPLHVVKN
ncbi:hypothetical protein [Pseudaminobacter salicylatoxidans]|uniref:hypothetical protein n=1 Tax=Pseudaminobacter salicylatoxidans TaxID=93369 RepID=UPI0003151C4C|nr:hypothetical protein [Pseudaminobacter salicylatoxidans]